MATTRRRIVTTESPLLREIDNSIILLYSCNIILSHSYKTINTILYSSNYNVYFTCLLLSDYNNFCSSAPFLAFRFSLLASLPVDECELFNTRKKFKTYSNTCTSNISMAFVSLNSFTVTWNLTRYKFQ